MSTQQSHKRRYDRYIKSLLLLYPPAWREYFGVEMLEHLQQYDPCWRDVADLIMGALKERLYTFFIGERFPAPRSSSVQRLLRAGMLVGTLISIPLLLYNIVLIRTSIDMLTLIGTGIVVLMLVGYCQAGLNCSRLEARPGASAGTICGLLSGLIYAVYISLSNLVVLSQPFECWFSTMSLGFFWLLPCLAGLLSTRTSRQITAGIRAGLLANLLGTLIGVTTMLVITYTCLDILNQNTLNYGGFLRSGVHDVTVFNIEDTIGGCFFSLLLAPLLGTLLGFLGGLLNKAQHFLFSYRYTL